MARKDGLRVETYASVSLTVPVKIADTNQKRFKLKLRPVGAGGCLVGIDEAIESDTAYFVPQNEELEFEKYKGPLYALSVTAAASLYVLEEDE